MKLNIAVIGLGFVGSSLAVLMSQKHFVKVFDIDKRKIKAINNRESPIPDADISHFFSSKDLTISGKDKIEEAVKDSEYVIIAIPTDLDEKTGSFNTEPLEDSISKIHSLNQNAIIVIKSTLPIGFCDSFIEKNKNIKLLFAPEFLREGSALKDNLYPERIVVGGELNAAESFAQLISDLTLTPNISKIIVSNIEAESIKLFANSYLAMRVAFFNELDNFAFSKGISSLNIIKGISSDSRIGDYYNNPSFGFGGYCIPKDIMQLETSFKDIPQELITSTSSSNLKRKLFLVNKIKRICPPPSVIGIYRLSMKHDSENFRTSAILDIISMLVENNYKVIIYEPTLDDLYYMGDEVITSFDEFKEISSLIIANRLSEEISKESYKVLSRDLFNKN